MPSQILAPLTRIGLVWVLNFGLAALSFVHASSFWWPKTMVTNFDDQSLASARYISVKIKHALISFYLHWVPGYQHNCIGWFSLSIYRCWRESIVPVCEQYRSRCCGELPIAAIKKVRTWRDIWSEKPVWLRNTKHTDSARRCFVLHEWKTENKRCSFSGLIIP